MSLVGAIASLLWWTTAAGLVRAQATDAQSAQVNSCWVYNAIFLRTCRVWFLDIGGGSAVDG